MFPDCLVFEYSDVLRVSDEKRDRPDPTNVSVGAGSDPLPLYERIVAALGPRGRGIVAIRGVPGVENLRSQLLPFARQLAALPKSELFSVLKVGT